MVTYYLQSLQLGGGTDEAIERTIGNIAWLRMEFGRGIHRINNFIEFSPKSVQNYFSFSGKLKYKMI